MKTKEILAGREATQSEGLFDNSIEQDARFVAAYGFAVQPASVKVAVEKIKPQYSVDLDTLTQSLTRRKTAFGGGVGYNFPKTNSSIDLYFNKNVYSSDNVPTTFTENRQNLYFSVKF